MGVKRIVLWGLLFGAPLWVGCADAEPEPIADPTPSTLPALVRKPAGPPPNVLLIQTDEERLDLVGWDLAP